MLKIALPERSSILVIGSPGIGLLEFNIGLAKSYIERGDTVVFVTIDVLPADVVALLEAFDVPVDDLLGNKIFIIDYHSSLLGSYDEDSSSTRNYVRKVSDIEGIMFNLTAIANEYGRPMRIFLHSLSTLFLYNQTNVVLKFFQISSSKIRSELGMAISTVHDGVHEDRTINHLMAMADGVIELKFDENLNRRLRIRHMRGSPSPTEWIPFEIKQARRESKMTLLEFLD
ncbi:MAG: RAD55 family ATPase [Methanomassiliicoccales archaeon]